MKTRTVQKFNQIENLNTVLDAAKRIGCNIVNMSAEDIIAGKVRVLRKCCASGAFKTDQILGPSCVRPCLADP